MNGKTCIDVSYHNGNIDFTKIKKAGIDRVIIRCGYGSDLKTQDDKMFNKYYTEATKQGFKVGVYLYSYAKNINDAKSEAKHVKRLIQGKNLYYPIMYDIEEECSKANAISIAKAFIKELNGHNVMIYANQHFFKSCLKGFDIAPKWCARYSSVKPDVSHMLLWQYTENKSIDGVKGKFDASIDYIETIAKDVIAGKYGNGEARKKKLGCMYSIIQKEVNRLCKH